MSRPTTNQVQRAAAKKMGRVWTAFKEVPITDKMRSENPILEHCHSIYANSRYQADLYSVTSPLGAFMQVAVRSHADVWPITWDDLQRVRLELFGESATAIEIYPPNRYEWKPTVNVRVLWVCPTDWVPPIGIHIDTSWGRS